MGSGWELYPCRQGEWPKWIAQFMKQTLIISLRRYDILALAPQPFFSLTYAIKQLKCWGEANQVWRIHGCKSTRESEIRKDWKVEEFEIPKMDDGRFWNGQSLRLSDSLFALSTGRCLHIRMNSYLTLQALRQTERNSPPCLASLLRHLTPKRRQRAVIMKKWPQGPLSLAPGTCTNPSIPRIYSLTIRFPTHLSFSLFQNIPMEWRWRRYKENCA